MPVKTFRPLTPSTRYVTYADYSDITKTKPEKSLVEIRKRTGGRNHYGRMTARGIGGGPKKKNQLFRFQTPQHRGQNTRVPIQKEPRPPAPPAPPPNKKRRKKFN